MCGAGVARQDCGRPEPHDRPEHTGAHNIMLSLCLHCECHTSWGDCVCTGAGRAQFMEETYSFALERFKETRKRWLNLCTKEQEVQPTVERLLMQASKQSVWEGEQKPLAAAREQWLELAL